MGVGLRIEVRSCSVLVALVVACAAGACGDDVTDAPAGARAQTTTEIGPAGGDVVVDDVTLSIPPGALATPTKITVRRTDDAAPTGVVARSAVYRFEPDGLTFATPALVKIIHRPVPSASVYWTTRGGGPSTFERLASTDDGVMASASIDHFSGGFVGVPAGAADAGLEDAAVGDASLDAGTDGDAAVPLTCVYKRTRSADVGGNCASCTVPPEETVIATDLVVTLKTNTAARPCTTGTGPWLRALRLDSPILSSHMSGELINEYALSGSPPLETFAGSTGNGVSAGCPIYLRWGVSAKIGVANGHDVTMTMKTTKSVAQFGCGVLAGCVIDTVDCNGTIFVP